jgi:hypothetical protein
LALGAHFASTILIVQVYVDDIVFGGSSNSLVARFTEDMSRQFEMSMMGELQFFLWLQIKQSKEGTFVHQAKYTKDIVQKFKMEDSKALDADEEGEYVDQKEYRSMIGSLLYLDGNEAGHPVLGMSVRSFSSVSEDFASASGEANLQVLASHSRLRPLVLRVLFFGASCFSYADCAGCRLDRKSISGTCQFLGSSLVSWSSRKQSSVTQSTIEAEYVAAASCCSQILWITYTMSDFGEEYTHVPL